MLNNPVYLIIIAASILLIGFFLGYVILKKITESKTGKANLKSKEIIDSAQREAQTILKEASLKSKDLHFTMKTNFEKDTREQKKELHHLEKRLNHKEENLEKKMNLIDSKEAELKRKDQQISNEAQQIETKKEEYNKLIFESKKQLEKVAGLTPEEAKQKLMDMIIDEAKHDSAKKVREIEEEAKNNAEKEAKKIIATAVQRYSGDYITERTVTVVNLPSDEMKGRIIGREGRNIKSLEAATGVDLIIDDTPEAVILSGYSPVRREVAKISLEKLINDGRIHPARIEEVVKKAEKEVQMGIKEAGEQATFDLGLHGIHPEIIKLLGSLKYRYSYSQNQYQHSMEVAFIAGAIASELGVNPKIAKRAGLLHDIGKAIDHEVEGTHAVIGADFAKKHGENFQIVQAIRAHHEDIKPESIYDVIIQAADSLSGARPGARKEMLESYIKRIEDIEKIANEFEGVEKTFAIQAGREVRITVNSKEISDEKSTVLARDIAKKIEKELSYPGQIKITVIREVRAVDYAK
ncbi:MAG: ribonuclease Y [Pseudomonadota bacterium]